MHRLLLRLAAMERELRELGRAQVEEVGARGIAVEQLGSRCDVRDQERLARVVAAKGLSVRATEALVRDRQKPASRGKDTAPAGKDADTARLERELDGSLRT